MPLISAKDYMSQKGGGSAPPAPSGRGSGGLISAKAYLAKKTSPDPAQMYITNDPEDVARQSESPVYITSDAEDQARAADAAAAADPRPDLRTDYPGGAFNPVNDINRFRKTAVGQGIDRFAQGAGHAIGLSDDQMSSKASTGVPLIDKGLDIAGGTAGYLVNPGMPAGNLGIAANFFEHPAIAQVAQKAGNAAQQLLPDAGLAVSRDGTQIVDSMLGKTVNKAAQGAVQGGLGAAAFSPFHTFETGGDLQNIPQNMLEEGLGGSAFGAVLEGASPSVSRALQNLLARRGAVVDPQLDPTIYDQANATRNVSDLGPANTAAQDELARRYNFIDRNTNGSDNLALPPGAQDLRRQAQEAKLNEVMQNQPRPGLEPIPQPGDVRTFALPSPDVAPATSARAAANPWRQKFETLINVANQVDHPPGRELESLQDLWSRMAGPHDPNLSELVDLAYPQPKVTPDTLRRAKDQQYARDVAGVSGPVRSMADRYDGGVKGEAAAPMEVLKSNRTAPAVEVIPPAKKSAVPGRGGKAGKQPGGRLVTAAEYQRSKATPAESAPAEGKLVTAQEFKQQRAAAGGVQRTAGEEAYAGNPIPFRQAPTQSERTINRNRVVKNIRKNLGVVVDSGKLKAGPGVLGIHKVQSGVIRSKMAEDLQVISHEVGHNLDKRFSLQDPQFQQEYMALIHNNPILDVTAYQPHQLPGEGVAEYVRLRLTDPEAARRLAPNFTRYFDSKLDPKTLKGLDASAHDIDTWITQGDFNQAVGLIDFNSGGDKQGFSWDRFYTRMVDDLHPLKLVEKALKGVIGRGAESIYKMARLSRGIGERAKLAVTRGIYDDAGNKISDGLAQIVKPLKDMGISEQQFATYLAVKHAIDLRAAGKKIPFSDTQIAAVMKRLDTPEVRAIQQKVIGWNDALLQVMVDAQLKSAAQIKAMRQAHPNYVPFMRYFDDDAIAGFKNGGYGSSKGFANVTDPVKRMSDEGSTRTIINPFESMVKNAFLVMNAAAKNKVGLQLADLSTINDAGAWVEALGKGGSDRNDHIVSVWINGERQQFKVRDPELYNALLSLDNESANSVVKFLGGAAGLLRAGATLSPEFLLRNSFRDAVGAMVNSTKYGFNPADFFFGLGNVLGKTETFDRFLSSGGAMSTMMALDREANREAMKAVFRLSMKDKAMNIIKSPKELAKLLSGYTALKGTVGVLRKAAEVSELSTKVGTYRKVLKKTGSSDEAAYAARDLMDFNRAGSGIRPANRMIAFLNAGIQGVDKTARSFWGDGPKDLKSKASFLTRAATTLVLPSIGLYYWTKNLDPERKKLYDNIPQWQKDSFFIVPIPGTKQFARIPKPFEAGMMFATGTDRMMRWLDANDPEAAKGYAQALGQAYMPPTLITAFTPIIEGLTNHSFFKNAPLVPQGEQKVEKKDQYGIYTSETAKQIGNVLSHVPGVADSNFASPRIIDNTIKGYTATLGQYGVAGLDALLHAMLGSKEPPQPSKTIYEQPPISSFLATTSGGGQVRQDFYDKWDQLSTAKNSADKNQIPFKDPEYGRMKAAYNVITEYNKQYKYIQKDPRLSPDDKRAKLDAIDSKMNDAALRGLRKK